MGAGRPGIARRTYRRRVCLHVLCVVRKQVKRNRCARRDRRSNSCTRLSLRPEALHPSKRMIGEPAGFRPCVRWHPSMSNPQCEAPVDVCALKLLQAMASLKVVVQALKEASSMFGFVTAEAPRDADRLPDTPP